MGSDLQLLLYGDFSPLFLNSSTIFGGSRWCRAPGVLLYFSHFQHRLSQACFTPRSSRQRFFSYFPSKEKCYYLELPDRLCSFRVWFILKPCNFLFTLDFRNALLIRCKGESVAWMQRNMSGNSSITTSEKGCMELGCNFIMAWVSKLPSKLHIHYPYSFINLSFLSSAMLELSSPAEEKKRRGRGREAKGRFGLLSKKQDAQRITLE